VDPSDGLSFSLKLTPAPRYNPVAHVYSFMNDLIVTLGIIPAMFEISALGMADNKKTSIFNKQWGVIFPLAH